MIPKLSLGGLMHPDLDCFVAYGSSTAQNRGGGGSANSFNDYILTDFFLLVMASFNQSIVDLPDKSLKHSTQSNI